MKKDGKAGLGTGQGVLAFSKEAIAPTQKQNTTKTQQFIAAGLGDTSIFEDRLLSSFCVEGSPKWKAIHQCVRCYRRTDNVRPVGWGNTAGPGTSFNLCFGCYKRRHRLNPSDREIFDLNIKIRLLRQMARTAGGAV